MGSLLGPHPSFHLSTRSSSCLVYWYHFITLLSLKCAQRETHHLLLPAPTHSLQPSFLSGHWLTMLPSFHLPLYLSSLCFLSRSSLFPFSPLTFFSPTSVSVSPLITGFLKKQKILFYILICAWVCVLDGRCPQRSKG